MRFFGCLSEPDVQFRHQLLSILVANSSHDRSSRENEPSKRRPRVRERPVEPLVKRCVRVRRESMCKVADVALKDLGNSVQVCGILPRQLEFSPAEIAMRHDNRTRCLSQIHSKLEVRCHAEDLELAMLTRKQVLSQESQWISLSHDLHAIQGFLQIFVGHLGRTLR
ncbi:MAG: hypothetical protein GKR94_15070 [Gammaproteobacteria bacterium]|nr:hypothetical protein [Gammaproteobacteria bacterium]